MTQEEMLVQELQSLDTLDRDAQFDLDDEIAGKDVGMEIELLAARVRAARLTGA